MNYQLEFFRNPNLMVIHVAQVLTPHSFEYYLGRDLCDADEDSPAPAYVLEIFELEGIQGTIWVDRYKIHIQKATLFSWDELAPKAIEIMRSYFEPEGVAVEVGKPIRKYLDRGGRRGEIIGEEKIGKSRPHFMSHFRNWLFPFLDQQ